MNSEEENKVLYVHCLNFETLTKVIKDCTAVNRCTVYTMAQKADTFAPNEKSQELINVLNGYNADEDWRMKVNTNVRIATSENQAININELGEIVDAKQCVVIPNMNMILIIPGDETLKKGKFTPADVIQLNNFFKLQPMMLQLESVEVEVEDEENIDGPLKRNLGAHFVIFQEKPKDNKE